MRRTRRSFRFHLGALGALSAIPFLIAGAVIAFLYVSGERQATERDLLIGARELSNAIDREVAGGFITLRTLASSQAAEQGDIEALYRQAQRVVGIIPASIVSLRDETGQLIFNTARPWGAALPRVSDQGVIASDREAFRTLQPVVSNLYTGAVTQKLYFNLALPVASQGKNYLLTLAISPDLVLRLIRGSSAIRPDWLVIVLDGGKRVIARSRDHENFVGRSASDGFILKLSGSEGITNSTTLDGTAVVDGFVRSPTTGFTVIAAAPTRLVNMPVRQAATAVAAVGLVGLAGSLLFAVLYGGYLTPPILRLRDNAEALIRREPVPPFETGIAELNAVSQTLAHAAEALQRDEHAKGQMIKELNHRVKNSLATVLSIARQTAQRTTNFDDFFDAFSGRIVALAQSHDALSEGEWVDADFADLVRRICLAMVAADRLTVTGPAVPLYPRAALTMGMVLHELCTNAAKYGALSVAEGRIALSWAVQPHAAGGPTFSFTWQESGGPAVTAPQERSFGTRFIENSIRHELGGEAAFEFRASGLVFTCRCPLRRPDAEAAAGTPAA